MAEQPIAFESTAAAEVAAQMLRHSFNGLQEGVLGSGDLKVTPSGSGLVVSVAVGAGFVQGDTITDQGLYRCHNDAAKLSSAFEAGGIAAAHGSLPRIDQICAKVFDHDVDGGGQYKWRLVVVPGTATSGATLDNRNGAAALPASHLRLADVLVPATFTGPFVAATHIRDRRPWAQGYYYVSTRTAGDITANTSDAFAELDATNLKQRAECTGNVFRFILRFSHLTFGAAAKIRFDLLMDGAAWSEVKYEGWPSGAVTDHRQGVVWWDGIPAAGSHTFSPRWATNVSSTLAASNSETLALTVEEMVRPLGTNS